MKETQFEELIADHGTSLFEYLRLSLPSLSDTQDVYQETCLGAWNSLDMFQVNCNPKTWLIAIAKRKVADFYRRRREITELSDQLADGSDFSDQVDLKLSFESLSQPDQRLLFLLFQFGLSYQEIAELEEIPVGTVKSRFFHLKAKLRTNLEVHDA